MGSERVATHDYPRPLLHARHGRRPSNLAQKGRLGGCCYGRADGRFRWHGSSCDFVFWNMARTDQQTNSGIVYQHRPAE